MAFFKKLKEKLFRSSSKLEEGLSAIFEDGGELSNDQDALGQATYKDNALGEESFKTNFQPVKADNEQNLVLGVNSFYDYDIHS